MPVPPAAFLTPALSLHALAYTVCCCAGTGNFAEANEVRRTPTPDSEETKYYKEGPKGRRVDGRDDEYERPWERNAYEDLGQAPQARRKVNVVAANARAGALGRACRWCGPGKGGVDAVGEGREPGEVRGWINPDVSTWSGQVRQMARESAAST